MSNFARGQAFHKASRTIIRAVEPSSPRRFVSTYAPNGFIIPPALGEGEYYIDMQGISQMSISVNDNNQDIRVLADSGWADGVVISSTITVSVTSYFMRDLQYVEGWAPGVRASVPTMAAYANGAIVCTIPDRSSGAWERGFSLIAKSRYEKDIGRIANDPKIRNNRIYIEILKEMGTSEGSETGNIIYDFLGFEAVISNYSENENADGLTEVSYDLISVDKPTIGKFTAGAEPPRFADVWNYSDFRDSITKESICRFGPQFTAIEASTAPSAGVENARYSIATGDIWLMMSGLGHFGVGRTVRLYGLAFGRFSSGMYSSGYLPKPGETSDFTILEAKDRDTREYQVRNATYVHTTGEVTLTLNSTATIEVGTWVSVSGLRFSCTSSGQPLIKEFPQESSHSMFLVTERTLSTIKFTVATSTIAHTYVDGGRVRLGPVMKLNVGATSVEHFYINGGTATVVGPLEADGTLSYNNADLKPRASSVYALP
jgi:hypothetical protein